MAFFNSCTAKSVSFNVAFDVLLHRQNAMSSLACCVFDLLCRYSRPALKFLVLNLTILIAKMHDLIDTTSNLFSTACKQQVCTADGDGATSFQFPGLESKLHVSLQAQCRPVSGSGSPCDSRGLAHAPPHP